MHYREDRYGNKLSTLGFGCMRFPLSDSATDALICAAISAGVNYFDTAFAYGPSEARLGKVLAKHGLRDQVKIAAKLPHKRCKSIADVERIFSEELVRLQTDHIDYYLIHNLSSQGQWQRLLDLGIKSWIEQHQADGSLCQLGFSFHGAQSEFFKLLEAFDWDFCQIQYNYLGEGFQAGNAGLERASALGLPVVIMEPLLGGRLAKNLPPAAEQAFAVLERHWTPAQWALAWVLNHSQATLALSGMNAMQQLVDNLAVADAAEAGALTPKELAAFESAKLALRDDRRIPCTGCNYCMPCPHGVNIPACFAAYNARQSMSFYQGMHMYITSTGADQDFPTRGATACRRCGICRGKCPQGIDIPGELEKVRQRMEHWPLGPVLKLIRRHF
ncbi:MAG: aldo/keto reductase [Coriobacteriales bacterium]|nr:aldo/keto reductase [Coriobacteriales bacterium]